MTDGHTGADDGPLTVAGVVGSQADRSVTRVAVAHALRAAETGGVETDLIDPRTLELPLYDADRGEAGDAPELCARLQAADAVVLGTPMYHGSYSSVLKTVLDYSGFDEFENVTVGLVGVAGGSFPITALDHLRSAMRALDSWVVPFQAAIPNSNAAVAWPETAEGDPARGATIRDDSLADRVATLGQRVVQYADIEPDPITFEGEQNRGA